MSDPNRTLTVETPESEDSNPGQDQVTSKPAVLRDERGRLLPGSKLNAAGRPTGTRNNTTLQADELLKAHAERAAQKLVERLDDPNGWIVLNASSEILRRSGIDGETKQHDMRFVRYLTPRELTIIEHICQRGWKRLEEDQHGRSVDIEIRREALAAITVDDAPTLTRMDTPAPDEDALQPDEEAF